MARDIWLTSDTHFYHENIIKFSDRPFKTLTHMHEEMLSRWNDVVKPGDKVYHLGDVLMGGARGREDFTKFWPTFHGKKRLIVGNHDDIKFLSSGAFFEKVMLWKHFDNLILSHVPIAPSSLSEGRTGRKHQLNVHGHTHTRGSPLGPYRSVCVELTNYAPIHIEEVKAYAESYLEHYSNKPFLDHASSLASGVWREATSS